MGGKKFDQQKNRVELVVPQFILAIGRVMTHGAWKYDAYNWMEGITFTRIIGAALRHIFAWVMGQSYDPETGESHLAHAACCLMFLFWYDRAYDRFQQFDDRVFADWRDNVSEQMVWLPQESNETQETPHNSLRFGEDDS